MDQAKEMLIKQVAMRARFTRDFEHFVINNKNSDKIAKLQNPKTPTSEKYIITV